MASVKLVSIQLENFKSFQHLTFNDLDNTSLIALVGLNGTGKSNLVDAFLFVLGETNAHKLRARKMGNLIHPSGTSCTVKLLILKDWEKVNLTRSTNLVGNSTYSINEQIVLFNKYQEELHGIGVDTLVRNYFVQQGSIREVVDMSNIQLRMFLEKMSKSVEFKGDYDRLFKSQQEVTQKLQSQRALKSRLMQRKNNLQRQLNELLKSIDIRKEHDMLELHSAVFEACQMNFDSEEHLNTKRMLTDTADKLLAEQNKLEEEYALESAKIPSINILITNTDKQIATLNKEKSKFEIQSIQIQEEMKFCRERKTTIMKTLETLQSKHEAKLSKAKQLEADNQKVLAEYQAEEAIYEAMPNFEATSEQFQEYSVLKSHLLELSSEEVMADSQEHSAESMEAIKCRKEMLRQVYDLGNTSDSVYIQAKRLHLEQVIAQHQQNIDKFVKRVQELQENHQDQTNLMQQVQQALDADDAERNQVVEEICVLNNCDDDSDEYLDGFVKRLIDCRVPGVIGKLGDLINLKPQYKQYQTAVEEGLGEYLQSIVVENKQAMHKCELYNEKRVRKTITFLPLEDLKVDEPSGILASIDEAILLSDVLEFDAANRRAILFACNNILLVENDKMAKMLSRNMGRHINVVSKSGTFFRANGCITSHKSKKNQNSNREQLKAKQSRLDFLNLEIRKHDTKLVELKFTNMKLNSELFSAKKNLAYYQQEYANALQRYKKIEGGNNLSKKYNYITEISKCQQFLEAGEPSENARRERSERLEQEVFADFCSRYNLASIRDFENSAIFPVRVLQEQKIKDLRIRIDELSVQLNACRENIKQDEESFALHQSEIKQLEEIEKPIKEKYRIVITNLRDQVEACSNLAEYKQAQLKQVSDCKRAMEGLQEKISTLSLEHLRTTRKLDKLIKQIGNEHSKYRHFLDECKRKNIVLPRRDDSGDEATTSMDDSSILGNIDFHILPRQQSVLQNNKTREATRRKYQDQLKHLVAELALLGAPNPNAREELEDAKNALEAASQVYKRLIREIIDGNAELERVQKLRADKLNDCYKQVNKYLDKIYKELMKAPSAQAEILPINVDCPFAGGFSYMCAIPGKGFSCVRELSTGERSLAALALYFALREYHPAPLLLLDEVDCNLDGKYLDSLSEFLEAHRQEGLQTVVVTHKPTTASKGDDMVAIYNMAEEGDQTSFGIVKFNLKGIDEMESRMVLITHRKWPKIEASYSFYHSTSHLL